MVTMTLNPLDELLKHAIQWQPAKWPVASQKIELAAVNELAPSMPLQSTSKVLLPPTPPPSSPVAASDGFAADWPSSIHRVGSGFYNQGNTCYLNATLQVLVHSPAFVTALLLHREHTTANCDVRPFCALCAMYFLMQGAFTGNRTVKGPAAFIGYLRSAPSHLSGGFPDVRICRDRTPLSTREARGCARVPEVPAGCHAVKLPGCLPPCYTVRPLTK
jgi:hypothetical protein